MKTSLDLWPESYRPQTTKDIILPSKVRDTVNKIISGKSPLPHFLLYYPKPGNGKTSLAKSLCADMGIQDILYLNASLDGTIDNLRNRITDFVLSRPIGDENSVKVVILDEMDKSSPAFQDALKVFIEEYNEFVRFFLITNNVHKIIQPLHSRTSLVDYQFENPQVKDEMIPKILDRLKFILKSEKVKFTEEILVKLVNSLYPDIRNMVKVLQLEFIEKGEITPGVLSRFFIDREFYDLILDMKYQESQAYLKRNGCNYGEMYGRMFNEFIQLLPQKAKANSILILHKYEVDHVTAMTPELTFAACTIELIREIISCSKKS